MKKEKNLKGFTLIELLAVIVILAVIALIAVPQVLKLLNKARLSSIEDSAHGIVESAEIYVSNFMLQNNGAYSKEKLEFECSNDGCNLKENSLNALSKYDLTNLESINFKGKAPNSGNISIDPSGKIALNLKFGNYCVYKSYMSSNINILNGDCYENLWFTDIEYPITKNGLTLDYDYDTQIYTLNGTSTENAIYFCVVSNRLSNNLNLGDKYIVKTFYIDGNFNRLSTTGNIHVKTYFYPGSPNTIQIIDVPNIKDTDSDIFTIDSGILSKDNYDFEINVWQGKYTFNNYRFKVYFGKVGPTDYIPTIKDIK